MSGDPGKLAPILKIVPKASSETKATVLFLHSEVIGNYFLFLFITLVEFLCFRSKCLIKMTDRLKEVRQGLKERLVKLGTPGTWEHITNQNGMFSFTGLTSKYFLNHDNFYFFMKYY